VNSPAVNLTPKQLRQAADLKERISRLQKQLAGLLGDAPAEPVRGKRGRRKKRKMSAEARAKISAAQKKRWAKVKK
jgi:hypothetical protein